MALSRTFNVREGQRIEIRAEAFNVTNSFIPGCPQAFINPFLSPCSPSGLSGVPSVGGGITIGNSTAMNSNTFGQIRSSMDPRIMQFALKYVF
jgi:hypothetical protein